MKDLFNSEAEAFKTLNGIQLYLNEKYVPILKEIYYNLPANERIMNKSEILTKLKRFKKSKKHTIYCTVSFEKKPRKYLYDYDFCWYHYNSLDQEIKYIEESYTDNNKLKNSKYDRLLSCFKVDDDNYKKMLNYAIESMQYLNKKYGEEKVHEYFKKAKEDN